MIGEDYKDMYASQYARDNETKMALRDGFQGFRSDSADCVLEHLAHYPVTIVLFYDESIYN